VTLQKEHFAAKEDSTPPDVYEEPNPTIEAYRSGGLENWIKGTPS